MLCCEEAEKTWALTMKEIESLIESFGVNVRNFNDAAHGHVVDKQFENGFVLMMFPLPSCGLRIL